MSKLEPINGHVIIKPVNEEEQMYGNIVIPDLGKEKANIAEVIAVNDTYNWHTGDYYKSKLNIGDKVLFATLGGTKISLDGEDYFIYKETEILAILKD